MHSIRLTDFWTITELEPGRICFHRRFGAPRLQDAKETVWLVGTSPGSGTLTVNGVVVQSLSANARFEAEITSLLKPRNEVRIEVDATVELGEVMLEIRS